MDDNQILDHINKLVDEEKSLQASGLEGERLSKVKTQLDQLWDLLRQRRAKEEYGQNPDEAEVRSVETVGNYTDTPYKGEG
ncbi:MAG: DUF2630 family protein [Thermaceae bacterium]|nr:DUF2630 family protein [Thermaceae bacterium]